MGWNTSDDHGVPWTKTTVVVAGDSDFEGSGSKRPYRIVQFWHVKVEERSIFSTFLLEMLVVL